MNESFLSLTYLQNISTFKLFLRDMKKFNISLNLNIPNIFSGNVWKHLVCSIDFMTQEISMWAFIKGKIYQKKLRFNLKNSIEPEFFILINSNIDKYELKNFKLYNNFVIDIDFTIIKQIKFNECPIGKGLSLDNLKCEKCSNLCSSCYYSNNENSCFSCKNKLFLKKITNKNFGYCTKNCVEFENLLKKQNVLTFPSNNYIAVLDNTNLENNEAYNFTKNFYFLKDFPIYQ